MAKNLVYIHLESLPQALFWQYQAELPTLWRMMRESMYFTRCFTTGAATVFAYNSIFRGSVSGVDHLSFYNYDHSHRVNAGGNSLIADLRDGQGYQTAFFFYNNHLPAGPMPQEEAGYGFDGHFADSPYDEHNAVFRSWLERLDRARPFAVYLHYLIDMLHHRLPLSVLKENLERTAGDMSALMMRYLDAAVANALERLRERDLLHNSMVVFFGDHGWDYQQRFNSPRFVQGSYVSSSCSWVPLYIHNSDLGVGVTNRLVSLDDFAATCAGLLGFPFRGGGLFPGVDITRESRQFAFTQNKFALQSTAVRGDESPKSYAVTDGMYRLVAADVNATEKTGGMALYLEQLDPGNQVDLLDLFVLDASGRVSGLNHEILSRGTLIAYPPLTNFPGLASLAQRYETLRQELRRYVREKEAAALARPGAEPNVMSEEAFSLAQRGWGREECSRLDDIAARIRNVAAGARTVLLFGSRAFITSYVLAVLAYHDIRVAGILDNMESEQYGCIGDITVYPPDAAARLFPGSRVVSCVCNAKANQVVSRQCRELGFEYISYMEDVIGAALW